MFIMCNLENNRDTKKKKLQNLEFFGLMKAVFALHILPDFF